MSTNVRSSISYLPYSFQQLKILLKPVWHVSFNSQLWCGSDPQKCGCLIFDSIGYMIDGPTGSHNYYISKTTNRIFPKVAWNVYSCSCSLVISVLFWFLCSLAPVLKTIFHQCVISYTCSQSNSDGSVWLQVYGMIHW